MEKMTRAQAKAAAAEMGVKYRISNGEVHFYGTMPNTNMVGWYLYAWAAEA